MDDTAPDGARAARAIPGPVFVSILVAALVLVFELFVLPFGCSSERAVAPPTTGDLTILVEYAASCPRELLEAWARLAPAAGPVPVDLPLTPLLWCARMGPPGVGDVRALGEVGAARAALVPALAERPLILHPDRVSALERNFIRSLTHEAGDGRIDGTVGFRIGRLLEGEVAYTARRVEGRWRVTEFRLPRSRLRTVRQTDGSWRSGSFDADPSD